MNYLSVSQLWKCVSSSKLVQLQTIRMIEVFDGFEAWRVVNAQSIEYVTVETTVIKIKYRASMFGGNWVCFIWWTQIMLSKSEAYGWITESHIAMNIYFNDICVIIIHINTILSQHFCLLELLFFTASWVSDVWCLIGSYWICSTGEKRPSSWSCWWHRFW